MNKRLALMLFIDALLALAAQCTAVGICFSWVSFCQDWTNGQLLTTAAIFLGSELFASYLMDVYTLDRHCRRWEIFINSLEAAATALIFLFVAYYLVPSAIMGLNELLLCVLFFFLYQYLWHAFSTFAVRSPHFCQRVLILGTGPLARQLGELIEQGANQYSLVGYLQCAEGVNRDPVVPPDRLVEKQSDLLSTVMKAKAEVIVVGLSERRGVLPLQEMLQCKLEGVRVMDAPTLYETIQEKLLLEEITPGWIIFSAGFHKTRLFLFLKRCSDITLALLGLLVAAPLFPVTALAIRIDSGGPIFFRQVRVGSGERPFTLYKFRSMRVDAERDGAVWAAQHDGRVTRVGRFLRQYRIDELPQLYNVLIGDMSFIGPRPERPEFVQSLNDERENALKAMRMGAFDFYSKPPVLGELKVIIGRAFHLASLDQDGYCQGPSAGDGNQEQWGMIGACPQMQGVFATIHKVAASNAPILITGESGTGKELVASAIHQASLRRKGPLVAINCGAIPENLLESELFGHERGSFTGAHVAVQGKLQYAHKGTLFLDEIGELPVALQVKLLRFLQEGTIQRVGGREEISIDARTTCATNVDIDKAIGEGRFREDLYYRIGVINIKLPPLRERVDDVLLLADTFLQQHAAENRKKVVRFNAGAVAFLKRHHWPGNVRELRNRVQRAVIMSDGGTVTAADLGCDREPVAEPARLSLREARERMEREMILRTMERRSGNVLKTAEDLGVSRPTLYDLMKKLSINPAQL
ncbi:MAG TPA: sigma 54-interacting transcriptional regulator [Geomonas sp.]|nr:sigma 54-interacting transcriptional regulator [Geomonas sp.]